MNQIHSAKSFSGEMLSDLLLREQLHRFSNSFQIVSSLANECGREAKRSDAAEMVEALKERLNSLAAVHRLLVTGVEMHEFARHMHEIARELVRSFGRTDIVILRADRVWLPEKHRFRIGLIVNELVTNVLKHSLCNCAEGLIEISLSSIGCAVVLTVSDSNCEALDRRRPLAPSPIVAGLAQSMGGVAQVVDQDGYAVQVVLPWNEQAPQVIEGCWSRAARPARSAGTLH